MLFHIDKEAIGAPIYSGSKVSTMTPAYAKKLDLRIWRTDVRAQNIDGSSLDMFEMVIAGFQVINKLGKA